MRDLHQSLVDILSWSYPLFSDMVDEYIKQTKERAEAEKDHEKDFDVEMHSKMASMQRQYSPPGLSGLSKLPGMSGFPSLSSLKF